MNAGQHQDAIIAKLRGLHRFAVAYTQDGEPAISLDVIEAINEVEAAFCMADRHDALEEMPEEKRMSIATLKELQDELAEIGDSVSVVRL